MKVETRGSVGAGNAITPEEVAAADLVIVAADIEVDLAKFAGKPMYRTSTGLALKKTAQELDKADEVYLCDFPNNAAKEDGIEVTIHDLEKRSAKAKVIGEDETAARMLAQRGPAVYLFMSSKDIYKLKNIVKSFQ